MSAKKIYWYGMCNVREDLKIREVRITKETATRLYLHKESQVGWHERTTFFNKFGGYENWFPTKKEAVAMKLKVLKKQVRAATENQQQAKKCLAEFKRDQTNA